MKAHEIYSKLDADFIKPGLNDAWAQYMPELAEFLCENFKARSMGLTCDHSVEIKKAYTAVFPSDNVMRSIIDDGAQEALLFLHHPSDWDLGKAPNVFQHMNRELLTEFRARKISIYTLHVPLDNYGPYSTSVSLARALGLEIQKPFFEYCGGLAGIIGVTARSTITELLTDFEMVIRHRASCYQYGREVIAGGRVAVIAGGGNDAGAYEKISAEKVDILVTGITKLTTHKPSEKAHQRAKELGINIIGGTHYSTEKFACLAMCDYFRGFGLESKFIAGKPGLMDL